MRDPEFTRLVKSISTSVVQALLTASSAPGAWAQPPDAKVEDAALLITPRNPRLEVAALLHVTYLAPQKSGPPKAQDLIKATWCSWVSRRPRARRRRDDRTSRSDPSDEFRFAKRCPVA